ncbi:MAG TPA: hypothetical protein V6C69_12260 [Trichormus sp.]
MSENDITADQCGDLWQPPGVQPQLEQLAGSWFLIEDCDRNQPAHSRDTEDYGAILGAMMQDHIVRKLVLLHKIDRADF